MVKKSIIN